MVKQSKNLFISDSYGWRRIRMSTVTLYLNGVVEHAQKIITELLEEQKISDRLLALLKSEYGCFGIIVDHPEFLFASVDRLRSYPVYYSQYDNEVFVANSAVKLRNHCHLETINSQSLLEFNMAGYVFNRDTLYRDLYQLQGGECLFWKKGSDAPEIKRYYRYVPTPTTTKSASDLLNELSQVVDAVVHRTIERAHGAPIWVPLSGGLDSRLIIAKLVEHKYDRLQTFSFGVPGNFEANRAKQVAEQLAVPWFFCPFISKQMKNAAYKNARSAYTDFAAGLCSVPSYLGFRAFYTLTQKKIIPADAIIINGQTGDFISGGHVPSVLFTNNATTLSDILEFLINKHCSLWLNLKTRENLERIQHRSTNQFPILDNALAPIDRLCSNYETWEWEERQSKMVVNSQRIYDFFRLKWLLPLWDSQLMDFWESVPYELKVDQKLYIDYLKQYNYKGVFDTLRDVAKPWTVKYAWIPWFARGIGLFAGKRFKVKYYHHMYYYATDRDQYVDYGRKHYLEHYKVARGVVSFDVMHYLNQVGIVDI